METLRSLWYLRSVWNHRTLHLLIRMGICGDCLNGAGAAASFGHWVAENRVQVDDFYLGT
ncbi:hypothetical protein KEH51_17900 [[Brevibacterium] frigoritolerans]|uniref:Uncharacterized protein n=1 Tax=Peribacillus frigoritolerans TaxID=450367 RepID=A0A941FKX4_9BACI|nr:hypothetical protein [Peribacillus frigoritolerans]